MNRLFFRLAVALFLVFSLCAGAQAATFTFTNSALKSLDHYSYYVWKVPGLTGETITSATITIDDIYNNTTGDYGFFTHLMQNYTVSSSHAVSGGPDGRVYSYSDSGSVSDAFGSVAGQSWVSSAVTTGSGSHRVTTRTGTQIPQNDNGSRTVDLTYQISSQYFSWLTSTAFYLGFDSDCHYLDKGVTLTITTAEDPGTPVPEPSSMALLGFGLVGLGRTLRRRIKK